MNPAPHALPCSFFSSAITCFSLGLALLAGAAGAAGAAREGAARGQPRENSLGQKFVPVPGTSVLFCIWETRVQDFEAFVQATGYNAEAGMHSRFGAELTWKPKGDTWRAPGFAQSPLHPVCGVNWEDAKAFCLWLTAKERKEGKLAANQEYRLPTDSEWSLAVGLPPEGLGSPKDKNAQVPDVYPWGTQYPPPARAGNFASEGDDVGWQIDGYADGAQRTAQVGSYTPNALGIYDLSGNLWEWCEDAFEPGSVARVLRGASWINDGPWNLLSSNRGHGTSTARQDGRGFRCVLATGVSSL